MTDREITPGGIGVANLFSLRGKTAKLGFTFPANATVLRKELYERIKEENIAAAEAGLDSPAKAPREEG